MFLYETIDKKNIFALLFTNQIKKHRFNTPKQHQNLFYSKFTAIGNNILLLNGTITLK
ncbi:hypothetical protein FHS10_004542 [Mucilaginibacter dorajii]|nr:hypothetical protein [Mucilaginibacter dorajii]